MLFCTPSQQAISAFYNTTEFYVGNADHLRTDHAVYDIIEITKNYMDRLSEDDLDVIANWVHDNISDNTLEDYKLYIPSLVSGKHLKI